MGRIRHAPVIGRYDSIRDGSSQSGSSENLRTSQSRSMGLMYVSDFGLSSSSSTSSSSGSFQILVPGCGNSRLSEHLYDAGFRDITNVEFSKVVITDMLRRNIRIRSELRWRIMDITKMQLADDSFDMVLDKGALHALMEP